MFIYLLIYVRLKNKNLLSNYVMCGLGLVT